MKIQVNVEQWNWPFFKADPRGFDYIELTLLEPSCTVEVKATISLEAATALGERLINLSDALRQAER